MFHQRYLLINQLWLQKDNILLLTEVHIKMDDKFHKKCPRENVHWEMFPLRSVVIVPMATWLSANSHLSESTLLQLPVLGKQE
jgi:hypothetical protein